MYRGDHKWVTARLGEKGWLYRAFEVVTSEGAYRVTYKGRGLGHESVSVNGEITARQTSALWFIPEFIFPVGSMKGLIKVSVWPWLAVRSFELEVNDEQLYSERTGDGL